MMSGFRRSLDCSRNAEFPVDELEIFCRYQKVFPATNIVDERCVRLKQDSDEFLEVMEECWKLWHDKNSFVLVVSVFMTPLTE